MDDRTEDDRAEAARVAQASETMLDGLRRQAADTAQQLVDEAKDGLRQAADRVADRAEAIVDQGRRYLASGAGEFTDRVDGNPVTAIIVAACVGFLLGVATNRRRVG